MRRADVQFVVDEVLRETLGAAGFHHAIVAEKPDEAGEDSFYVDVHFRPQPSNIQSLPILEAVGAVRARLLGQNEERFPYLHFMLTDDEPSDEEPQGAGV